MRLETSQNVAQEGAACDLIAARWNCQWGRMGRYSPFDVYLTREKRLVAIAEIRTRLDRTCRGFATNLVDLDKWYTLMELEKWLKVRSFYVVAHSDGVWYIPIGDARPDLYTVTVRGRTDRPQAPNDRSLVIDVPSKVFRRVCDSNGIAEARPDPEREPGEDPKREPGEDG